jgi:hypothetical protein
VPQAPRISIASIVHDPLVAERYLLPSLEALDEPVQRLVLSNIDDALTTNLASLHNVLLRLDGPTRRAFVHPDVTFDPDLVVRLAGAVDDLEAAGSPWGAVGIVGRAWEGDYVWAHELDAPRPVCTLDSCFVLTRTDLGLAFDEKEFDELHCFVEDYCLQCHAEGRGVWVVPAAAWHANATYNELGARWGKYDRYRKQLDKKWRRRFPNLVTV